MDAAVILFIATFTGNEWTFPIANSQNDRFVDHNIIVANENCRYHFLILLHTVRSSQSGQIINQSKLGTALLEFRTALKIYNGLQS